MTEKPLAVDLYAGLGGWTEGLLAEGYHVVGFDIEAHEYDGEKYPGSLVLQDVLTLHGLQFKDAALIVASPPCQEFSYMAMPWRRAKQIARALRGQDAFPEPYTGSRTIADLTALFDACFRIQREASEAAGRHIPMVVENVRGAVPWVGPAAWNYGSYYLWGDVPALMPHTLAALKNPGFRFDGSGRSFQSESVARHVARCVCPTTCDCQAPDGSPAMFSNECPEHNHNPYPVDGCPVHDPVIDGVKVPSKSGRRTDVGSGARFTSIEPAEGRKGAEGAEGAEGAWFNDKKRVGQGETGELSRSGSKSPARKAAAARIAKIPLPLSQHIAKVYLPRHAEAA